VRIEENGAMALDRAGVLDVSMSFSVLLNQNNTRIGENVYKTKFAEHKLLNEATQRSSYIAQLFVALYIQYINQSIYIVAYKTC
jgi:hypothetical protein